MRHGRRRPHASIVDVRAVNSRRRRVVVDSLRDLLLLAVVDVDDVESVDVAGEEGEDGEGDVDEEVGAAAGDYGDAYWRDWEGC